MACSKGRDVDFTALNCLAHDKDSAVTDRVVEGYVCFINGEPVLYVQVIQ